MLEYSNLMQAARLLLEARRSVSANDGPDQISPAWRIVKHAEEYVLRAADVAMRGTPEGN